MSETSEHEQLMAIRWSFDYALKSQIQLECERQSIDFNNVKKYYNEMKGGQNEQIKTNS